MKTFLAVVFVMTVQTAPLMAQQVDRAPAREGEWLTFMVALGLLMLAAVGSFLGSRRGHQD